MQNSKTVKRDRFNLVIAALCFAILFIFVCFLPSCSDSNDLPPGVKGGEPSRDDPWIYADVSSTQRDNFTGQYRAYDGTTEITSTAEVYFKLLIDNNDQYCDDFGGRSLTTGEIAQFQDASDDGDNLAAPPGSSVDRVDLQIGAVYVPFYLE